MIKFPLHIVAAGGIVEDGHGNVLLVKSPRRGWEFPGGQVEVGESVTDGVIREIIEESGIDAEVVSLIGMYSNISVYTYYDGETEVPPKLMLDFIMKYKSGKPTTSDETEAVMWVARDAALNFISHPAYRYRYERYLEFSGKVTYSVYESKPEFKITGESYV